MLTGSGNSSVVQASDLWLKGLGFKYLQENFLLQGQLSVTHFGIHSTPVLMLIAHKRSWSFCHMCRWQVTAKHTYTIPVWLKVK